MPSEMNQDDKERARQDYQRLTAALRDVPTTVLASTCPPVERPSGVVRAAEVLVGAVDRQSVSRVADALHRLVDQVAGLRSADRPVEDATRGRRSSR